MPRVISIHEYELKPNVSEESFEQAVLRAAKSGLLRLPGLVDFFLVKGVRGVRRGRYAAVWVYESKEAWERLWGAEDQPIGPPNYPENWRVWEHEVLAPFLDRDPDRITYTAYEELE